MSIFDAIILGIVEGFTEFLPISSTAHLMLISRILAVAQTDFVKTFEIFIQLGAIAAVLFIFGPKLLKNRSLWPKIALAFVPTAVVGFILYKLIKSYLIGNITVALFALLIGGVVLIIIEKWITKRPIENEGSVDSITNTQAVVIGLSQSLAVIPGVSRAAATIIPMLLFGSNRKTATEFSFLLAIPTVAAAAGYDLLKSAHSISGHFGILLIGFIVSFIAAWFSIRFLLSYVQTHRFTSFGWYRIAISIIFLALIGFKLF